ncbi:protein phosphatase 1 regulatory subunit 15B-like [Hippoglossus hippoglossus]|uniref:protein phosphatase 1 regulatory subunit 15B-like n=1 Tax=Hippoglossus hippoglossus TaxID=8267 RepID=UPI00148E5FE9|nr:protein phosphatase 1 regulatory subunit 15B-like [Hippoglossus hippoglossus]
MDFPSSNEEEENQADDEASDSDTKEEDAESLSLFNSFSRSPDPYNPFNFQGPDKASQSVPSPSECRTKEERLDNALPEASAPTPSTSTLSSSFRSQSAKKVRFSDHVEARFLSGEEDRRSPWQEAAVNRFRFQRRCQEVEKIISYCLQPEHRSMVYKYLYPNDTSPTHCVSFTGKNTEEK